MEEHNTPVPHSGQNLPGGKTQSLNLDYSTASMLSYCPIFALNVIFCIIFLATEPPQSKFVRFHALQSLMLFGSAVAICFISAVAGLVAFIPILGPLIAGGIGIVTWLYLAATVFVSLFMMYKANQNEMTKLPIIGHYADRYSTDSGSSMNL